MGLHLIDKQQRSPHFLGATIPKGARKDLVSRLAEKNIYLSERGGKVRITPHLWNEQKDFDKLIFELAKLL
jgi:selenocysteine lyase/cysteine desulfurase